MASATEEIAIRLGVKTGDLKAALADASASIKTLKRDAGGDDGFLKSIKDGTRSLNDFKQIFLGGALAGAVKSFFALAIESANKSTEANDKNAASVREFAKGLEEVKGVAGKVAVAVVGFFNGIGEKIGDAINLQKAFLTGGVEGVKQQQAMQAAVESTARAAEEAERRIADLKKKHGSEFIAITKEIAQLTEKMNEARRDALTPLQQEEDLLIKVARTTEKLADFQGEAIDRRRIEVDLMRTQLQLVDATAKRKKEEADVEKQAAADRKKALDEEKQMYAEGIKAATERKKERALSNAEEIELFTLRKKNQDLLTRDERERLKVLELQKKQKADQVELDELAAKLIDGTLTPGEEKRLITLTKQKKVLDDQIQAKQAQADVTTGKVIPAEQAHTSALEESVRVAKMLTEELDRQDQIARSRRGTVKQEGDVRNLNNTQIDQLILNLGKQISQIKAADDMVGGVGGRPGSYKSIEQRLLQQNLEAAMQEKNVRRDFANTQEFFGDKRTQQTYAPSEYERLSQFFNPDLAKKQAKDIANITTTLSRVFSEEFPNS